MRVKRSSGTVVLLVNGKEVVKRFTFQLIRDESRDYVFFIQLMSRDDSIEIL